MPHNVYGDLGIQIVLYNDQAVMPELPFDVTLAILPVGGGTAIQQKFTGPGGGFALTLRPGRYRIRSMEVRSPSVSPDPFVLDILSPSSPDVVVLEFTVPDQGCTYIGLIHVTYYRFPGLPLVEQIGLIQKWTVENGRNVAIRLLEGGTFANDATVVQLPGEGERVQGSAGCAVQLANFQKP